MLIKKLTYFIGAVPQATAPPSTPRISVTQVCLQCYSDDRLKKHFKLETSSLLSTSNPYKSIVELQPTHLARGRPQFDTFFYTILFTLSHVSAAQWVLFEIWRLRMLWTVDLDKNTAIHKNNLDWRMLNGLVNSSRVNLHFVRVCTGYLKNGYRF